MSASPVYSPERGTGTNQFEIHTLTLNWDDADLLTGRVIWTPRNAGEVIFRMLSFLNVVTAFDGATPRLKLALASDVVVNTVCGTSPGLQNQASGSYGQTMTPLGSEVIYVVEAEPIAALVDDGADGPVGGTAGQVVVSLITADLRDFVVAE